MGNQKSIGVSGSRKHSFTEPPTKKPLLDAPPLPDNKTRESSKSPRVPLLETPGQIYRPERYGSHRASPVGLRNESESPRSKVSNPPTPKHRESYRNDNNDYYRSNDYHRNRVIDNRT